MHASQLSKMGALHRVARLRATYVHEDLGLIEITG